MMHAHERTREARFLAEFARRVFLLRSKSRSGLAGGFGLSFERTLAVSNGSLNPLFCHSCPRSALRPWKERPYLCRLR